MQHDLNTRMRFVRAACGDPRLTNRQQRLLSVILTYMPFDSDEGWVVGTKALCQDFYRGTSQSQMANTRKVLGELENLGFVQRVYAGSRMDMHSDPTLYVNWYRLLEPFREPKKEQPESTPTQVTLTRHTSHPDSLFLISTQEHPDAGEPVQRKFEVVG